MLSHKKSPWSCTFEWLSAGFLCWAAVGSGTRPGYHISPLQTWSHGILKVFQSWVPVQSWTTPPYLFQFSFVCTGQEQNPGPPLAPEDQIELFFRWVLQLSPGVPGQSRGFTEALLISKLAFIPLDPLPRSGETWTHAFLPLWSRRQHSEDPGSGLSPHTGALALLF